jgi:hypothetical protein
MSKPRKYFYSAEQIYALRNVVEFYGLEVPKGFWKLSLKQLQAWCNGCGPERWNDVKRRALTSALSRYEAAFMLHDVAYSLGLSQRDADLMLLRNMRRIFRRDYGFFWWLNKAAWIERITIIPTVYAAVRFGGDDAYNEAQKGGE